MNRQQRRRLKKLYKAVCDLDEKTIRAMQPFEPSSDRVFWSGVHKIRAELDLATEQQKEDSRAWLLANGFNLWSGGRPHGGVMH